MSLLSNIYRPATKMIGNCRHSLDQLVEGAKDTGDSAHQLAAVVSELECEMSHFKH